MPSKRFGLPHTFPHKIVFIISLVLCLCACGSIVTAVVAWSNSLWGYYLGTGFWSGAVILLAGMFGIVASYIRNICAVKTFMIISIFGFLVSLGMIALAAGGLDPQSGFYSGYNQTLFMTHVVHAVYLGLGVLQVALCVLSDGICIYYLFIERNAEIYNIKNGASKGQKNGGNIRRQGKDRASTGSQVPLIGDSKSFKRKDQRGGSMRQMTPKVGDENADITNFFPIPYTGSGLLDREAILRQELLMSKVTPSRNTPYNRSSSFSTFGRISGPVRQSLIIHPSEENVSTADTSVPHSPDDECHYAQTMLFGPPFPIEHDETLPPYEIADETSKRKKPIKPRRGLKRPKSEELNNAGKQSRRPASLQNRERRINSNRSKSLQIKGKIPDDRNDNVFESGSLKRHSSRSSRHENALRLSRSEDMLSFDDGNEIRRKSQSNDDIDGKDFRHSGEVINVLGEPVQLRRKRPQSHAVRVKREHLHDRRRKALSAEVKLNKARSISQEGNLSHDYDQDQQSSSLYGSNPSLFAASRIRSTKFSLRRPGRQTGIAPVPVKPLVSVPTIGPPPKPPRNYSVTADDLNDLIVDPDDEAEQILADINDLINNETKEDDVFAEQDAPVVEQWRSLEQKPSEIGIVETPRIQPQKQEIKIATEIVPINVMPINVAIQRSSFKAPLSQERKLNTDPGQRSAPPNQERKPQVDKSDAKQIWTNKTSESHIVERNNNAKLPENSKRVLVLPTSPVTTKDYHIVERNNNAKLPENSKRVLVVPTSPVKTKDYHIVERNDNVKLPENAKRVMVLPTSPVLKGPPGNPFVLNNSDGVKQTGNNSILTGGKSTNDSSSVKYKLPNNVEVIYAKIRKESSTSRPQSASSPVSPSSPTSPTSPSAKVQTAKRLTYTIQDKGVSVFDPLGNSTESEQTAELVESVSVKYPVRAAVIPPETKHQETLPIMAGYQMEPPHGKTVRIPSISPSEKILQRKSSSSDSRRELSPSKEERPIVIQLTDTSKDFNKNASGARPKSSFKGVHLSPTIQKPSNITDLKQTDKTQDKSHSITGKASDGTVRHSATPQNTPIPKPPRSNSKIKTLPPTAPKPDYKPAVQPYKPPHHVPIMSVRVLPTEDSIIVPTSPTVVNVARNSSVKHAPTHVPPGISSTTNNNIGNSDQIRRDSSNTNIQINRPVSGGNIINNLSATRDTSTHRVHATTGSQSIAQGVLVLPQSQFSRRVSDNDPPHNLNNPQGPQLANNIPQNAAQNNDDNTPSSPFFSAVL